MSPSTSRAPPRDRNAAPLYLDALFEFGSEIAECFPEGPERQRRRQAAIDRMRRYQELAQSIATNPAAVAPRQSTRLSRSITWGSAS